MSDLPAIILPSMSQALVSAVNAAAMPHPEAGLPPMPNWMRPEAEAAERRLNAALAPVAPEVVVMWLVPLAAVVARAPAGMDLRSKVQAMAMLLTDLPACCWTPETQRSAARAFKWWPSVAEVAEFLEPYALPLRRDRAALSRMLREQPRRGAPAERAETPEARAANAEKNRLAVEALRAEFASRQKAATPIKPAHISPAQRIAYHRQRGDHATADAIARTHGLQDA